MRTCTGLRRAAQCTRAAYRAREIPERVNTVCMRVGWRGGGEEAPLARRHEASMQRELFSQYSLRTRYNTSTIILLYARDASRAIARP